MRRSLLSLSKHFLAQYKNNNTNNYTKQPQARFYNHNLTLDCGDVIAKVSIESPFHRRVPPSNMIIKTYRSVTFRCVKAEQMFVKGSKYINYSMNLDGLKLLLGCDFYRGDKFQCRIQNQYMKIQPALPQHIKKQLQNPKPTPNGETEQHIVKIAKSQLKHLNVQIKIQKQLIQQIAFRMPIHQYKLLKKVLWSSLPSTFGLDSAYQMQADKLINKIYAGEILEEGYQDEQNFVL